MKKEKKSKKMSAMFKEEGIVLTTLSAEKREDLFKRWLEIYGDGSKEERSCLVDKYDYKRFPALSENESKEKYENLGKSQDYFLILDHHDPRAYQVQKGPLPSWEILGEINSRGKDVCVTGLDLSWTLFFGNEGQTGTFAQGGN